MSVRLFNNLSWRSRRQLSYLAIPIIPTLLIGGWLLFKQFTTASCSDGRINQGERGIDCEGPCPKLCEARIVAPKIIFSDAYATNPGTYNLVAMVENQNEDLGVYNAGVIFTVFNADGVEIYSGQTNFDLRPSSTEVAFLGAVNLPEPPTITKAEFNFTDNNWQVIRAEDLLPEPTVLSKEIIGSKAAPRVEAVVKNNARQSVEDLPIVALIKSENDNVISASATTLDIDSMGQKTAVFTWPQAFPTTTGVCSQPVDVMMAIDASGSMNSLSENPPEPLTSVKTAARGFATLFSDSDTLGVVSFANDAELVTELSTDSSSRLSGINSIVITPEAENGYTNIAAALRVSLTGLSTRATQSRRQAVILLTDGVPTAPDNQPDPELAAISEARLLASSNIDLFVIGLGSGTNFNFLNQLVQGDRTKVFQTSNANELSVIYSQIATAVCERSPYQVEIYPNIGL